MTQEYPEKRLTEFTMRLGDFGIRKTVYLFNDPEIPNFSIVKYIPNQYYLDGKEKYFFDEDGMGHPIDPETGEPNLHHSIDPKLFENEECNVTVATFNYDKHEEMYNLEFYPSMLMDLTEDEVSIVMTVARMAISVLNWTPKSDY